MLPGPVGLLVTALLAVPSVPSGTDVDHQLGGATQAPAHVGIVVRDREEQPHPGLMIEYRIADFEETCQAYAATRAVVLRDGDLSPEGVHRWC